MLQIERYTGQSVTRTYIKTNQTPFDDALQVEAQGLDWLRKHLPADKVSVPTVYEVSTSEMAMDRIQASGRWTEKLTEAFAEGLASMHREKQPYYGFEEDNYIGLNPQSNRRHDDWGSFFLYERLQAQVVMIADTARRNERYSLLEVAAERLVDYLNQHCAQPSLVHGDLWRGNCLCDDKTVWLIDPAVHFADREVDIAMTEFFGGFPSTFVAAYNQCFALSPEYPRKRDLYNLYHALNHYNLFGESYWSECERGFRVIESL